MRGRIRASIPSSRNDFLTIPSFKDVSRFEVGFLLENLVVSIPLFHPLSVDEIWCFPFPPFPFHPLSLRNIFFLRSYPTLFLTGATSIACRISKFYAKYYKASPVMRMVLNVPYCIQHTLCCVNTDFWSGSEKSPHLPTIRSNPDRHDRECRPVIDFARAFAYDRPVSGARSRRR